MLLTTNMLITTNILLTTSMLYTNHKEVNLTIHKGDIS